MMKSVDVPFTAYIINTLDGRVQIDLGTKCTVIAEDAHESSIRYRPHGPNSDPKKAIVSKRSLGLDTSSLYIYSDPTGGV
jgi:hypothetical protein